MSRKATLPNDHQIVTSRHSLTHVKKLDAIAAAMTQKSPGLVTRADVLRLAVSQFIKEIDQCSTKQLSTVG